MASFNIISLCFLLVALTASLAIPTPPVKHPNSNHAQFVHEKEEPKTDPTNNDETDEYHLTNDYKPDSPSPPFPSWNPFAMNENSAAARYLGLFGYPSPLLIPYPVFVPQEPYYPYQDYDDYEDPMGRASNRRGSGYRNSPIYYLRLPPTPYMFIPGLGYHSQPPTFTPSFSPLLPYNPIQALPVQPAINPFINLPIPFISNGKPTGIYQLDSNQIQSQQFQQYQPQQIPHFQPQQAPQFQPQQFQPQQFQPQQSPQRPYRPNNFPPQPQHSYIPSDTKISQLKRPFMFNGRPDQIYLLQGSFNPVYQSPIPGYY